MGVHPNMMSSLDQRSSEKPKRKTEKWLSHAPKTLSKHEMFSKSKNKHQSSISGT